MHLPSLPLAKKLNHENELRKLADDWLAIDVNPETRKQIEDLLAAKNWAKLDDLLSKRIVFGTAGLRARMEAGFSKMNDVTVLQASQGLAKYIIAQNESIDPSGLKIVVGHDHRHHSLRFAQLTAAAFLHYGFTVYYLGPNVCATPNVPYAVDYFGALGGIMVTSSHNPKDDNGYKVYWKNGCQIIPPHDSGIQKSIQENLEPFFTDATWNAEAVCEAHGDRIYMCKAQLVNKWLEDVEAKLFTGRKAEFKFVYTPMHGVGLEFARKIAQIVCNDPEDQMIVVGEQAEPDPDFPTVPFPNPEEKGALDLGMKAADEAGVPIVIANDPDADRFSVAYKTAGSSWRQLSGNEIGYLFAQYVIQVHKDKGLPLDKVYLVNSTVSSQMIKSMAQKEGFHHVDTLTGFKWIGNKAIDLEAEGYTVPFGYEEAIGFMFALEHDKDGLSALAVFLQMYQSWLDAGKTPIDVLEDGFKKYGYFQQCNGYYRTEDISIVPKVFSALRATYKDYPKELGEFTVDYWRDLTVGYDSTTPDHKPTLPVDASSQMISAVVTTGTPDESVRFTMRGSGTEPKLKVYIEAKSGSEARSKQLGKSVWITIRDMWIHPDSNNLTEVCME